VGRLRRRTRSSSLKRGKPIETSSQNKEDQDKDDKDVDTSIGEILTTHEVMKEAKEFFKYAKQYFSLIRS